MTIIESIQYYLPELMQAMEETPDHDEYLYLRRCFDWIAIRYSIIY